MEFVGTNGVLPMAPDFVMQHILQSLAIFGILNHMVGTIICLTLFYSIFYNIKLSFRKICRGKHP